MNSNLVRCLLGMLALLSTALPLGAGVTVNYRGQDKCHLSYSLNEPQVHGVELRVQAPDNSWRTLASGTTSISGNLNDENLPNGTHIYELRIYVYDYPDTPMLVWQTVGSAVAVIDGTQAGGTLLFDETLKHDALIEPSLTVPDGKTLHINAVQVSGNIFAGVTVYGQIEFDPAAVVSCGVSICSRHDFSNIGAVNLTFFDAGASSTIVNSSNFTLHAYSSTFGIGNCVSGSVTVYGHGLTLGSAQIVAPTNSLLNLTLEGSDYTLDGLKHIGLSMSSVSGVTHMTDCDIRGGRQTFGLVGSSFYLNRVTWRGGETVFQVPVKQADRCDFQAPIRTEQAEFRATDCEFGSFHAWLAPAGSVSLARCRFAAGVAISGGAPEFTDCEFVWMDMHNRNGARVENSTFLGSIYFVSDEYSPQLGPTWYAAERTPMPHIANNAFMGECALEYSVFDLPVATPTANIGANYYGDKQGTRGGFAGSEYLGWERGHAGAWVRNHVGGNPFALDVPLATTGLKRHDSRVFPSFWLNDWIAGQYTIPHENHGSGSPMVRGRDTLVSLDVLCSEKDLSGVHVYAEYNNQVIPCEFSGPIHRDRADYRESVIAIGGGTFDLVLPAVDVSSAPLSVYLDASKVTGYDEAVTPTEPVWLLSTILTFDRALPTRPVRIVVVPVQLGGLIVDSAMPSADRVVQVIKNVLPEMIPIAPDKLFVAASCPVKFHSSLDWISSWPLLNTLSAALKGAQVTYNLFVGGDTNVDIIVGVLPKGSIHMLFGWGAAEGANLALRRDVILVDESNPTAALHELGHAIGLNNGLGNEQYEINPPGGRQLGTVSIFATSGHDRPAKFNSRHRAMHFPGSWYNWYSNMDWWDLMSNVDETVWPDMKTLNTFIGWLDQREAALTGPEEREAALTALALDGPRAAAAPPASGYRRVLVQGTTVPVNGTTESVFVAGSLSAFDTTELGFPALDPPAGFWHARHTLRGFNAANTEVFNTAFNLPLGGGGLWQATFDLPDSLASYTLTRDYDSVRFLEVRAREPFSNRIETPTPGTHLQDSLNLTWSASITGLQHLIAFSTNAGVSWMSPGFPRYGESLSTDTDFLPTTGALSIRIYSSDGLTTAVTQINDLVVDNRRPRITIRSPIDGDSSVTNVTWQLVADVTDPDGNLGTNGYWWSSLSGTLATGRIASVVLAPGAHTLRYVATDLGGLSSTGQCMVRVYSTLSGVDFSLGPDSLHLQSRQVDPVSAIPVLVAPGVSNSVVLQTRNQGVDSSARLSLYCQPPVGPETLLTAQTVEFSPFARGGIRAGFLPTQYGTYTFRGVVDQAVPGDPVSANNQYVWQFASRQPSIAASRNWLQLGYGLAPGDPGYGQYRVNARIYIYNQGTADLHVGLPTISGPAASVFAVTQNTATGMPIQVGQTPYMDVWATMTTPGLFRATLTIPSDDPRQPAYNITLFALLVYPGQTTDTDGDGVFDLVESAIGWNPALRDSDGDGLDDVIEDRNANGVVDAGETNPLLADTDGDGVPDSMEDANHNGRQDYGETSPLLADTDGDGMSDGDEAVVGTHPFLASDCLKCILAGVGTNQTTVRWPSKAEKHYQVQRTTNLTIPTWTDAPTGGGTDQQSARTAGTNAVFEYRDPAPPPLKGFYRIRVQ